MQDHIARIEGDIQTIKQAIGLDRPAPPDSPTPHLLLAAAGILSIPLAWILELLGSPHFPFFAALIIGVPPLLAMTLWKNIKARDPLYAKPAAARLRSRREMVWQFLGTTALIGILVACGFSIVSGPVILTMLAVLAVAMLNRPMVDHAEFSSIGWFIALALLAAWMLLKLPSPSPRGSIVGIILIVGGALAATIAFLTRPRSQK